MKIAILTLAYPENDNYGAVLQGYALKRYLCRLGHQAGVVHIKYELYSRAEERSARTERRLNVPNTLKPRLKRLHQAVKAQLYAMVHNLLLKKARSIRLHRFRSFLEEFCFEGQPPLTVEDIRNGRLSDDLIIVGSDLVWNLSGTARQRSHDLNLRPTRVMLGFFPLHPQQTRIAFSASQGLVPDDDSLKKILTKAVQNFALISVREQESLNYLKQICRIDCPIEHTVDPTLLLQAADYDAVIRNRTAPAVKYVLIYAQAAADVSGLKKAVIDLHSSHPELKLIAVNKSSEFALPEVISAGDVSGPVDFLLYVKNAAYLLTNSVYGMIFAACYHVPLTAFVRQAHDCCQQNLAEELNIKDRLLSADADDGARLFDQPIDFAAVDRARAELIRPSEDYLRRALELAAQARKSS